MNSLTNLAEKVKTKGLKGLVIAGIVGALGLIVTSIFQDKIPKFFDRIWPLVVDWWKSDYPVTTRVSHGFSVVLLVIILSLVVLFIYFFSIYRKRRYVTLNYEALAPPKEIKSIKITNTDVAIAVSNARLEKLPKERAVETVVDAVNQNSISTKMGSEYLEEFGYHMSMKPDGRWIAVKKERK